MQISVFWQLAEEVLVNPQGSWSCFAPSRWSFSPSRRCGEVSSGTWFRRPGSFFQSQLAGSMVHSHRGWWWQETCTSWICWQNWWCCTSRSYLVWPFAAIAEAILMRTSTEQVSSLHRVSPRYLKLVTSSNLLPVPLIFALMLFVLLVAILLFSVLTSIPYAVDLSTSLLARSWSSSLLPPIRSMSSANRTLHMSLPPVEMDVWWSCRVFCMTIYRNRLDRMIESKHPWRTRTVVLKNSPSWLFEKTALLEFSCSAWMAWISPSSVLKFLRTCHKPASYTLSNFFLKSMKMWNRSSWCCRCFSMMTQLLKAWPTVLRTGLKPACSSTYQQFLSLGLELVENNSVHKLAGMVD